MAEPAPASASASKLPWIIAGVAGAAFVALLVVYYVVLRPYASDHVTGELSSSETDAVTSAATDVTNILSYRRAHFAADYNRAIASSTGDLKKSVVGKRNTALKALTTGKFDLSAKVTHQALSAPVKGGGYVVLLTINGYRSSEPAIPMQQNLRATVVQVNGKWLVRDLENIGVS